MATRSGVRARGRPGSPRWCWRISYGSAKLAAMTLRILLVTGIVAALAISVMGRDTAADGAASAVANVAVDIDSARLLTHLSVLAHDSMEGRGMGTDGAARARRYLVAELRRLGVEPLGERYEAPFDLGRRGTGVNLLGVVPGTAPAGVIVLSAHYDHDGVRSGEIYNGADDNASGVAAVLEIARVLEAEPGRNTVVIALFDDEEAGLNGARAFVAEPPLPLDGVLLNVNLDMVSRANGLLWGAGTHHTPALRPVLEAVAAGAPLELRLGHDRPGAPEGDDWTSQSDHQAFHEQGIPFVYFGVEDHPDYHRPTDDFDRVDPGDFVRSARTILLALKALDAALPLSDPDALR